MVEQLRAVGTAISRPVAVAGALLLAGTSLLAILAVRYREGIAVGPEFAFLAALAAPLFPIAVWKGTHDLRRSYIASLPVDRTRHVLAKLAAGWAWLMVLVASFIVLLLALAAATGGDVGVYAGGSAADASPSGSRAVNAAWGSRVSMPVWRWAPFFAAATVMYLFGSAVLLAAYRTRWWLGGIVVGCTFVMVADAEGIRLGRSAHAIQAVITSIWEGRHGLQTLMLGARGPGELGAAAGDGPIAWHRKPAAVWVSTTFLWAGLAAGCVILVVSRRLR